MVVKLDVETEDEEHMTCWCGAKGTYDELFAPLPTRCGGSGMLYCECGGDLCVCHNHGEMDCDGCPDCEGDDDDLGYGNEWR
jgi:hypothetical protein